jgi:hypothetical protein
VVLGDVKL